MMPRGRPRKRRTVQRLPFGTQCWVEVITAQPDIESFGPFPDAEARTFAHNLFVERGYVKGGPNEVRVVPVLKAAA